MCWNAECYYYGYMCRNRCSGCKYCQPKKVSPMTTLTELKTIVSKCPFCLRRDMTVYTRDEKPFGCSGCLGQFFQSLSPIQRPWPMSFWDDIKSLFG
jgi:hypothetical protein